MATVQDTYDWCRRHGFSSIRLHPRSKAAISRDYTEKSYSSPSVESFSPDKNIGVVLGPSLKGPVDVDIDCPEAVFFAPYFLPPTGAIFGRKSKPRSHYLYVVKEPCQIMQLADKSLLIDPETPKMMIELRGDSSSAVQTVLPGSVHESGELISWATDGDHEPSVVTAEELIKAVKKVAAAVMVVRHYWRPDYHAMDISGMAYRSKWPLDEAVDFVKAVMEYDGDDDKSRIPTVRLTYRKAESNQKFTGATVLKSETGDHRGVEQLQSLMRGFDDVLGDSLNAFDERWAVVHYSGKTRATSLLAPAGSSRQFFDIDDFHQWTANERVVDEKGKSVPISKLWFPRAPRNLVTFLPGVTECDAINEWTGWAVEPKRGEFSAFQELLTGLCGSQVLYDAVLTFIANIFREPMRKPKVILAFIGRQSAGKTLLWSYISKIVGDFMVMVSNPEQLTGKFNNHLALSLLVVSEEAVYAANHRHMQQLKALSGSDYMTREIKGGSVDQVRNFNRVVILSNDYHAAPIEAGDSRYIVIDTGDFLCPDGLYRRIAAEMQNGGPAALFHHLTKDYDYDLNKLKIAKEHMAKSHVVASMKLATSDSMVDWWQETLIGGQLLPLDCWSMQKPNDVRWPEAVARSAIHWAYARHCEEFKLKPLGKGAFWPQLARMVDKQLSSDCVAFPVPTSTMVDVADWIKNIATNGRSGGQRRRITQAIKDLPPLEECRKAFETYMGQQYDWSATIEESVAPAEPMEY